MSGLGLVQHWNRLYEQIVAQGTSTRYILTMVLEADLRDPTLSIEPGITYSSSDPKPTCVRRVCDSFRMEHL